MSDIIVDFTISQINANLSVDPAPNVTLNVQDPMTANFYIEGTTPGNIGNIASINLNGNVNQYLNGNGVWVAATESLTNLKNAYEVVTLHTTTTGTYNHDILNSSVSYSTANAVANITINFRGNSTTTLASQVAAGKSITAVYLMTTGSTGYIPSTIQVDGVTQSIRYVSGLSPSVIPNIVASYTYTMIKITDSPISWVVLGSQTRYG